jgi:hypothetical protein
MGNSMRYWFTMSMGVIFLFVLERPFFYDYHPHMQIFFEELAFALILASLFGLTVEKYQREEFVALVKNERVELKRDVFLYAYGHTIPDQIRQEIRDTILDCPFHRENLRIDWKVAKSGLGDESVLIEKRYAYSLINDTKEQQEYHYSLTQVTADRGLRGVHSHSVKIRLADKSEKILKSKPTEADDDHLQTLETVIPMNPGEVIEVCVTMVATRRSYGDDTYSSKHPVVGQTTINFRAEGGLALKASASCKGTKCAIRTDDDRPNFYAWEINEGLLPFQGIVIGWSPMAEQDTSTENQKT